MAEGIDGWFVVSLVFLLFSFYGLYVFVGGFVTPRLMEGQILVDGELFECTKRLVVNNTVCSGICECVRYSKVRSVPVVVVEGRYWDE